ncbi:MAG: hypothetical protein IRZ29_02650 [Thermoflavifilum sp.]|nr:hypothetical protein [Thermoflavifilum sp.]
MTRLSFLSIPGMLIQLMPILGFAENTPQGERYLTLSDSTKPNRPVMSIYQVALVCNADPSIGCGSRAKPVLLALEKQAAVQGAWLYRKGTMMAIAWKSKPQPAIVDQVLQEYGLKATPVDEQMAIKYLNPFPNHDWLKGAQVDELSRQEAITIAHHYANMLVRHALIPAGQEQALAQEVARYFQKELVKTRSVAQLIRDEQTTFRTALLQITEKYIGPEKAEQAIRWYDQSCQTCEKQSSCGSAQRGNTCCG